MPASHTPAALNSFGGAVKGGEHSTGFELIPELATSDIAAHITYLRSQLVRLERGPAHEAYSNARRKNQATLTRVHRAYYLPTALWDVLDYRSRQLALIIAVDNAAQRSPVFAHQSAVVLHGLPLYNTATNVAHITVGPDGSGQSSLRVKRHRRAKVASGDIVTFAGLRFTSANRTMLDLAQSGAVEDALAAADAYLKREFRSRFRANQAGVEQWREQMAARARDLAHTPGVRNVREVLQLADPAKDSILESISHLRLARLGFQVELQVAVRIPNESTFYVDFRLKGLGVLCECDGKSKYTDARFLNGRTAQEAVYDEKRRQDMICNVTNERMIRWGYRDVRSELQLALLLAAAGVAIPLPPPGLHAERHG